MIYKAEQKAKAYTDDNRLKSCYEKKDISVKILYTESVKMGSLQNSRTPTKPKMAVQDDRGS